MPYNSYRNTAWCKRFLFCYKLKSPLNHLIYGSFLFCNVFYKSITTWAAIYSVLFSLSADVQQVPEEQEEQEGQEWHPEQEEEPEQEQPFPLFLSRYIRYTISAVSAASTARTAKVGKFIFHCSFQKYLVLD